MEHINGLNELRALFPAWNPTDEEVGLYLRALSPYEAEDVSEAVKRHRMEAPSSYPIMSQVIGHCRGLKHDRALSGPAPKLDPEYESTQQWIKRTIESATPEEIAAVHKRVPMSKHMPGLVAAGIETIRKERRWR